MQNCLCSLSMNCFLLYIPIKSKAKANFMLAKSALHVLVSAMSDSALCYSILDFWKMPCCTLRCASQCGALSWPMGSRTLCSVSQRRRRVCKPTPRCTTQRGVHYFANISTKTKLFTKPFLPNNQGFRRV